jgi:hypothetical protein
MSGITGSKSTPGITSTRAVTGMNAEQATSVAGRHQDRFSGHCGTSCATAGPPFQRCAPAARQADDPVAGYRRYVIEQSTKNSTHQSNELPDFAHHHGPGALRQRKHRWTASLSARLMHLLVAPIADGGGFLSGAATARGRTGGGPNLLTTPPEYTDGAGASQRDWDWAVQRVQTAASAGTARADYCCATTLAGQC